MYWAGIFINALFPIIEGILGVWFFTNEDKTGSPDSIIADAFSVSVIGVCLCLITSGVMLIYSVAKIKHFMDNRTGKVNTRTLVIHSTSFGLYTLAVCLAAAAYVGYCFNQTSKFWLNFLVISSCIQAGFQFIA